jgi:hypothetical protein
VTKNAEDKAPRTTADRLDTRLRHLGRLGNPNHGLTVSQANNAFLDAHQAGPQPTSIMVRRAFLARDNPRRGLVAGDRDKTPRAKPPLATSVRPRGVLLKLELALLFLAQCQAKPTTEIYLPVAPDGSSDPQLIDFFASGIQPRPGAKIRKSRQAMREQQIINALTGLAAPTLQLIEVTRRPSGKLDTTSPMYLTQERGPQRKGAPRPYVAPSTAELVISIPIEFFTMGWLQVLTDSEIANWLMWRDQGDMRTPAVTTADDLFLDGQDRLDHYDLSRDAWDTHQMLTKLGLMTVKYGEVEARLTARGTRFDKEPHRFGVDDEPLKQDAHAAVLAAVSALADGE